MSERSQLTIERLYDSGHLAFVNEIKPDGENPYIEINLGSGDERRTGIVVYRVPFSDKLSCIKDGDFVAINTTPMGEIKIIIPVGNIADLDTEFKLAVSNAFECHNHPAAQDPITKELKRNE